MSTNNTKKLTLHEALSRQKALKLEIAERQQLITQYSADYENETPLLNSPEAQAARISSLEDEIRGLIREHEVLSNRIQYTNATTYVDMVLPGGKIARKTIATWVLRRRELNKIESTTYAAMNDRNLRDRRERTSGGTEQTVRVRRYYDTGLRDNRLMELNSEPRIIDCTLGNINATTFLKEMPADELASA